MKEVTYHRQINAYCTCFADKTSRLVITLSFTDRSSEYCKNELSKGNIEKLFLFPSIYFYVSTKISVALFVCVLCQSVIHLCRDTLDGKRDTVA